MDLLPAILLLVVGAVLLLIGFYINRDEDHAYSQSSMQALRKEINALRDEVRRNDAKNDLVQREILLVRAALPEGGGGHTNVMASSEDTINGVFESRFDALSAKTGRLEDPEKLEGPQTQLPTESPEEPFPTEESPEYFPTEGSGEAFPMEEPQVPFHVEGNLEEQFPAEEPPEYFPTEGSGEHFSTDMVQKILFPDSLLSYNRDSVRGYKRDYASGYDPKESQRLHRNKDQRQGGWNLNQHGLDQEQEQDQETILYHTYKRA